MIFSSMSHFTSETPKANVYIRKSKAFSSGITLDFGQNSSASRRTSFAGHSNFEFHSFSFGHLIVKCKVMSPLRSEEVARRYTIRKVVFDTFNAAILHTVCTHKAVRTNQSTRKHLTAWIAHYPTRERSGCKTAISSHCCL